jgi:hypothetical protein
MTPTPPPPRKYMHNSIRFLLKPLACRDFIDEYDAVHPES